MQSTSLPLEQFEQRYFSSSVRCIAGVDEVGRGALAGPLFIGIVCRSQHDLLFSVNDSKLLSLKKREDVVRNLFSSTLMWSVGVARWWEIDAMGLTAATTLAIQRGLDRLRQKPDLVLLDGLDLPIAGVPCEVIVKGDQRCWTIACAANLAKVLRDQWMARIAAAHYPLFGFEKNVGYGTRQHREALLQSPPSRFHRCSFRGVA